MQDATPKFMQDVSAALDQVDAASQLTADERDIVDDFASQEFSASSCAEHIHAQRQAAA